MNQRMTVRTGSIRLALVILVTLLGLVPAWAMADGELDTTFTPAAGWPSASMTVPTTRNIVGVTRRSWLHVAAPPNGGSAVTPSVITAVPHAPDR